jgi:non-specific riboncleoside hydrolase
LCSTGALTNIALLFSTFPDIKDYIEKLIIMGGAVNEGNVTKHAEYNIYCDPEAAQIVFHMDVQV